METKLYNFKHDVNRYNRETHALDFVRTDEYYIHPIRNTILIIERNGIKKNIRIKPDNEFVYSVQKTQVKAKEGAEGLAKFLADPEWRTTAVKVLDAMMDNVKPATIHPWEF